MNKKFIISVIIISVTVILIGGIWGYCYIFSQKNIFINSQPQTEQQTLPTQNSKLNDNNQLDNVDINKTADWINFIDSQKEFSFKYPVGWQVEEKSGRVGIFHSLIGKTPKEEISLPKFEISTTAIYIIINPVNKEEIGKTTGLGGISPGNTLDSYANFWSKNYLDYRYGSQATFSKRENIMVGNKSGIKLEFIFKDASIKHYVIITESGDNWYEFSYDARNSELINSFSEILSTFKFK